MSEPSFSGNNLIIVGAVIAIIYFIIKFLEMRFIETESQKPMKVLIRDTIVVCVSSIAGIYVLQQFKILDKADSAMNSAPAVFVGTPEF
jgi:uncharacterized membrane protein